MSWSAHLTLSHSLILVDQRNKLDCVHIPNVTCRQSQCVQEYDLKSSWVKVFRIIPEIRILRLTFHRKSASKCWIREIILAPDLFAVCLGTLYHLNLKSWMFSWHIASFQIVVSKVQDFGNFELSLMRVLRLPHPNDVTNKKYDFIQGILVSGESTFATLA